MIILALGTNIEPREQYLKDALTKIEENILRLFWKVGSMKLQHGGGIADQNFLNMCIEVETLLGAYELLDTIQK